MRVGGKREVAQLSAFDMILLITVGDLVSQGIVQEDYSVTAAVIAVTTFTLAGIALNAFTFRYPRFRPWLAGRARIVVRDGEPLLDTLAGERMTIQDVHEAARGAGHPRLQRHRALRAGDRRLVLLLHPRRGRERRVPGTSRTSCSRSGPRAVRVTQCALSRTCGCAAAPAFRPNGSLTVRVPWVDGQQRIRRAESPTEVALTPADLDVTLAKITAAAGRSAP